MTFSEIYELTIPEYELLMEAQRYRRADEDYHDHAVAWLTCAAGSTNKKGRPVYAKFNKFYNYSKALKEAGEKPKESRADRLKRYYNERQSD